MIKEAIKNTEFVDAPAPILEDLAPELLIRVYPYIMINADKERMFIQNNSISITTISQYPLIDNGEFHNLVIDEHGALYFDLLAATVVEGKMDIASSTSVFGNTFQFEHRFNGITDQFFDHKNDFPVVFTFGEPFSEDKFEKGELEVYTSNSITPAGNYDMSAIKENTGSEINEATLTEIDFVNIKVVEAQFTNARVIFTRNENLSKNVSTFDGRKGISLGIQSQSLVHSIKGKGLTQEFDSNGNLIGEEFGEVDLISKEKWAPFKFTPSSTSEKLSMYADWFDYDAVLPFVYAEKFKVASTLGDDTFLGTFQNQRDFVASGLTPKAGDWRKVIYDEHTGAEVNVIQKWDDTNGLWVDDTKRTDADIPMIQNKDDLKMIEDMIAISAGYASSWDTAPVLTSGTNAGTIDPHFRVGHAGIKAAVIAGKDPIKVIDGIYEKHLRNFAAFETDISRYQPARAVMNALSRYLYTSYAIGKGQNSYNMAYLPWYLEPAINNKIDFGKKLNIDNPDKGAAIGSKVDTFVLNDGIKFQVKSIYFHDEFSSDIALKGRPNLILPTKVNFSNQKLVQTDRKLTLPELPDTISPITKLPLPGDINTKSSEDLKYLFYIPIQDQTKFEEFMLNTLTVHSSVPVGTDLNVQLPRGVDGKKWTQDEANAEVLKKQPGNLKVQPGINRVQGAEIQAFSYTSGSGIIGGGPQGGILRYNDLVTRSGNMIHEDDVKQTIARIMGYEDWQSITITFNDLHFWPNSYYLVGTLKYKVEHDTFTPAVVTTTSQAQRTYSYQARQVIFDKQEWKDFLVKFGMVPDGFTRYSFDERPNWKIDKIDELIITSVWGDALEIFFGTSPSDYIRIPMFNKDDETIATQRILFN